MSNKESHPNLFGLNNSNRDFSNKKSWGKNQFNSSFPASLCCYFHSKQLNAVYLNIKGGTFAHSEITIQELLGNKPDGNDTFFAFETVFTPYQKYVIGKLPRTDLVVQNSMNGTCSSGLEIKLTAIPDNATCELEIGKFGSELVVRPDTIVYLACSIMRSLNDKIDDELLPQIEIKDWTDAENVLLHINEIIDSLERIYKKIEYTQTPFLLQPIWKTDGKSSHLSDSCLDIFSWSNAGFLYFLKEIANADSNSKKITRQTRTVIWLYKMLYDVYKNKQFNHKEIIDTLSYNTKNDKAFASSGNITNRFMGCERLKVPKVEKSEIKNIILGGGQNLLSPERRFDAIIFNSPELFQ